MVHHGEDQDRNQGHEHVLGTAAPQAENAAHLALVGGAGRAVVGLRTLPGHGPVEQADHADQEVAEVEVGHVTGVEGVDLRVPRGRLRKHFANVAPTHQKQQIDGQDQKHEVGEGPLDEVGDHHRNLAADKNEIDRGGQQDRHQGGEQGQRQAAKLPGFGQAQVVDEEMGADGGEDAEVDQSSAKSHGAGEDAEAAAVTVLEKLGEGQSAGAAETVVHPAADGHDHLDQGHAQAPPAEGEPRLVTHLQVGHHRDGAQPRDARRDRQQVTPG